MAGDHLVAVASWLTEQYPATLHTLSDLGAIVDRKAPNRAAELGAVQAAVKQLDAAGLVAYYHHVAMSQVGVLHREGLARVAAGEPLATVAADVEPDRPVTIVRTRSGQYAAWHLTAMRLPAGAPTGVGGAMGATPDLALAALRARVTAELDVPSGQRVAHRGP